MTATLEMATARRPPLPVDPGRSRRVGSILGLVVGEMVGGGQFDLPADNRTDGASMALCLAESLVETGAFDPADQMRRYLRWWREGRSLGTGRDVGLVTQQALTRFEATGEPFAGSTARDSADSGSVIRLAPVVAWAQDAETAMALAHRSSRTTHGAAEAVDGCELLAELLLTAYLGRDPTAPMPRVALAARGWSIPLRRVAAMAGADGYAPPARPTGHVVDTLAWARRCVARGRSFREAVLLAADLGDHGHAVAAVTGQIAGARWGAELIPTEWLDRLPRREQVQELAERCVAGGRGSREVDEVREPCRRVG